jgi:two-component SAPR family response regulator
MNLVDDYLWNEVEDIIEGYRNATLDRLAAEYDSVEENMKATIARAKRELERCQLERQRLLTAIRKGYATEAEAELQFKAIMADEEQWEEELAAAEAIESNTEAVQEGILNIVGTVLTAFDFGFILTQEQKKEILNTVLDKFVLYRDGRVELRLKVPVNETQVTDSIITPLRNEILFNEVIKQLSS